MATGKTNRQQKPPAPVYEIISATPSGALKFYQADVLPDQQPSGVDVATICPECNTSGVVDLGANGAITMCISCGSVICQVTPKAPNSSTNVLSNQVIQALARSVLAEREEAGRLRDENEFLRARRVDVCESEVSHGTTSSTDA